MLSRMYATPAPGYRDFGRAGYEGVVREIGNNGFSWSSTVSGTNAFYLNFNSTNLNPSNANNRGHGFQVRCLQAFIDIPSPIFSTTHPVRRTWLGAVPPNGHASIQRLSEKSRPAVAPWSCGVQRTGSKFRDACIPWHCTDSSCSQPLVGIP